MIENEVSDEALRKLEAKKLLSEIERNNAERDSLVSKQKNWWRPSLLGFVAICSMFAAFEGFFSDLYQVAVTDRAALKTANDKLIKESAILAEKVRISSQAVNAALALSSKPTSPVSWKESTLYGAIIVTRWGSKLQESHAVILDPGTARSSNELFAHGAQLGIEKPDSDLGLMGGADWSGKWKIKDSHLKIVETYPRPFEKGITIEIDASKRSTNGRYPATRTRGSISEPGVAEIIFRP